MRAYRLLLEASAAGTLVNPQIVVNVASGRTVSIRWIAETFQRLAGCSAELIVDSNLVRAIDPPEIAGDATFLAGLTGWTPSIALEQTLADILTDSGLIPHSELVNGGPA